MRRHATIAIVIAGFVWTIPAAVRVSAQQAFEPINTSPLLAVENAVLPPPLVPGPAAHEDLPAYYIAANPQLHDRFARIRARYDMATGQQLQAVTLVAGDAGIGKTFLKSVVFRKDYPTTDVLKFDIREQYEEWLPEGVVTLKADLHHGDQIINRLPSIANPSDKSLLRMLESSAAKFIVIDSIDELHPDDYVSVLSQVEQFAMSPQRDFVHVVVFGRPCAFVRYWQLRQQRSCLCGDVELFLLNPPQLRTTGDLLVSDWNYCGWKFDVSCETTAGKKEPISLATFSQWSAHDYVRSGPFASISYESNDEICPHVRDTLLQYAQHHRVINATLYNLAGNSIIRQIVADRVRKELSYNERQIMDAYFRAWLERDYQSDGRPSYVHPEHVDLYLRLLERVAVKALIEGQMDSLGFFSVDDADTIQVWHDGQQLSFTVQRILDRSGLKHIDPRQTGIRRYRFEPIWLHRYLVQRYNERQ